MSRASLVERMGGSPLQNPRSAAEVLTREIVRAVPPGDLAFRWDMASEARNMRL